MSPTLYSLETDTPLGPVVLESDGEALTGLWLPASGRRASGDARIAVLDVAVRQLREYFERERQGFDLALRLDGTEFQRAVWDELTRIPYGTTVTYAVLAERIGRPTAFRAVGQAVGRNPIAIVVPCHRVVAANGLGGYAGGLQAKRSLLALEGAPPSGG